MVFICNSLLVSPLLDVSQELPREPWLGTLVLVAGFLLKAPLLQRQRYIEADSICEGVKTATHISEASQ